MVSPRWCYLVQDVAQSVQAGFPAPASVGDPLFGGGHRRRFDPAHARPPDLLGLHNPARLEDLHVLDDSGKGHRQGLCQFADRGGSQGESFHHGAPALVGQRLEGPIQVDRLVKHVLEYVASGSTVKYLLQFYAVPGKVIRDCVITYRGLRDIAGRASGLSAAAIRSWTSESSALACRL